MDYLHYISGPAIGALIGYCTNYIAVKMLFHPYKEVKLFGLTLPFTPGVIPKNKPRLARAISRAVADVLLTKEDIAGLITDAAIDSAGTALVAGSGLFGEGSPNDLARRFGMDGLHTEQLEEYLTDKVWEGIKTIDIGSIAGFVLLVPALGLIGRLAYPIVFKKCGECEHRTSIMGFIGCILASVILCLPLPAVITALCLCFISATISMINTSMLSIFPMRFAAAGNVSSVSGIMDFATYLGSSLSAALFGWMFTAADNFSAMYGIWIAVAAVSIVILGIYKKRNIAA